MKLVIEMRSVDPIRTLIHNMGIDSSTRRPDGGLLIPKYPSIVLGSAELSVFEMAGAYSTFANNGVHTDPVFVTHIEDKNGRLIYKYTPRQNVALSPQYNYVMVDLLRNTGNHGAKAQCGGKTGTTNDYVDGWFVGFTPEIVVATWVGGEDNWIRFRSLALGQGSMMAKPFFRKFIAKLENDPKSGLNPEAVFTKPPGDLGIEIDCDQYKRKMARTR